MRPRIVEYLNNITGIDIFGWLVPSPPVIYAFSFVLVVIVFVRRCKTAGLEIRVALDIAFWGSICGFIFARLFYLFIYQQGGSLRPADMLSSGGTASWGVYAGVFTGAVLYLRLRKRRILPYLDIIAASLPLSTFVGRWSCFMYGCDYGTPTDVAWGVRYPFASKAFAAHFGDGLVTPDSQLSAAVHPNQIYLSLNAFVLFFLLTWFWKNYRSSPGLTFVFYLMAYGISRFLLDFFRDDAGAGLIPGVNLSQMMCIFSVSIGVAYFAYLHYGHREFAHAKGI